MTEHFVQKPPRKISTSKKAALIAIPAVLLVTLVFILVSIFSRPEVQQSAEAASEGPPSSVPVVQENSHILDDAGEGAPVFVEFLDFECEACGAAYPVIEDVRKQYDGKVTFVTRYFMTNHANSMNAAVAVEAAAKQGKFEKMYQKLFESQAEWAEQQTPQVDRLRGYADELGLNMSTYDRDVADPNTQARVQEDHDAGLALGVRGTPTFFLNGEMIQPRSVTDLTGALDAAVAAAPAASRDQATSADPAASDCTQSPALCTASGPRTGGLEKQLARRPEGPRHTPDRRNQTDPAEPVRELQRA